MKSDIIEKLLKLAKEWEDSMEPGINKDGFRVKPARKIDYEQYKRLNKEIGVALPMFVWHVLNMYCKKNRITFMEFGQKVIIDKLLEIVEMDEELKNYFEKVIM